MHDKLLEIQLELKVPKKHYNKFGNYYYRNAEDILEAAKPLCHARSLTLTLSDEIVAVGNRTYVKATAVLTSVEPEGILTTDGGKSEYYGVIKASAYAREEETKKGMDAAQITGSASSYARKYALNGLFAIDDTKDPDATNTHGKEEKKEYPKPADELEEEIEL